MPALREVFARFGIEVDDAKLKAADKAVNGFSDKLQKVGALLAGGAVVRGVFQFAEGLAEQGSLIQDNSRRLGISTEAYQALGYAAKISGASVEALSTGLLIAQDKLADAATKGGDAAKAFSALGISVKDGAGQIRPAQDVMLDAADAISKLRTPAEQTSAAVNLFGRQGRELLPFLKEGRAGIEKLTAEFGELGGGFDRAAVAASDEFGDALDKANAAVTSIRGRIAVAMLPVLQRLVDAATRAGKWFVALAKNTHIVEIGLIALGAVMTAFAVKAAIAIAPLITPFLFWGAVIGALIIVFDELWTTINGGDSYLRDFIDGMFGVGATATAIEHVKAWWVSIVETIKEGVAWIGRIIDKIDEAYVKARQLLGMNDKQTLEDAPMRAARNPFAGADLSTALTGGNRAITGAASNSVASTSNAVNVVVNAGNADARETARLVRQEVERVTKAGNRAASVTVTREAPAE